MNIAYVFFTESVFLGIYLAHCQLCFPIVINIVINNKPLLSEYLLITLILFHPYQSIIVSLNTVNVHI